MSWSSDDGLHRGYVVPEFGDGQRGLGITGVGVPEDHGVVGVGYEGPNRAYVLRPAGEVVGWRPLCGCRSEHSGDLLPVRDRWHGGLLTRAAAEHLEDIPAGMVYAADEDVAYVGDGDDVADFVVAAWMEQHVGPRAALASVEHARVGLGAALEELNRAMAEAHDVGVDSDAVIRAAGLPRMPRDFASSGRSIDALELPLASDVRPERRRPAPRHGPDAMMTIHKLTAGDGYTYLSRQVASADERRPRGQSLADYYTARGNPPGVWLGGGAIVLGVDSTAVSESQMRALFGDGCHPNRDAMRSAGATEKQTRLGASYLRFTKPEDGKPVRRPIAGYDLVFTLVKSTSVLWALGGPEVRHDVEAAHHEAVDSTMKWIEQHAAFTRTGHAGIAQVDTTGPARSRSPASCDHCSNAAAGSGSPSGSSSTTSATFPPTPTRSR